MSIRNLVAAVAFAAWGAAGASTAVAQTDPAAVAKGYKAPRDAWGRPDLSGVWSPATITRLERDPKLGERLVLTDAEAKALEGENAVALHRELLEIAQMAGHHFMVDVALTRDRKIAGVFAGEPVQAHRAGVQFVSKVMLRVQCPLPKSAGNEITSSGGPAETAFASNLYRLIDVGSATYR